MDRSARRKGGVRDLDAGAINLSKGSSTIFFRVLKGVHNDNKLKIKSLNISEFIRIFAIHIKKSK